MRPKPILLENGNHFTDFCTNKNGFGYIQNQSLDKCEQIIQFIAHEKEIQTNQPILALMEMVLDASKTNP
jgi:hypothetical protein